MLSDISLKKDIVQATSKLDDLMKVNIVNFKFINDVTNTKQIGVIAQELEKIFPSMIDIDGNTKTKSVKYKITLLSSTYLSFQKIIHQVNPYTSTNNSSKAIPHKAAKTKI